MDRHSLTIRVTQRILGHFEITQLHGPIADKMLCYAILQTARDNVHRCEEVPQIDDRTFELTIEIRRNEANHMFEFDRMRGPGPECFCFIYGMLEMARDAVRFGIGKAQKVKV